MIELIEKRSAFKCLEVFSIPMRKIGAGITIGLLANLLVNGAHAQQQGAEETNDAATATVVVIETNVGDITAELFDQKSPLTVENFLSYVDSGHYNETIFHRVIPKFMIQGGGFNADMAEKPTGDPIENESKNRVYNERGTLAMARLPDPHSATSQFYINLKLNRSLDYRLGELGYAVFGKVIDGMHLVDSISLRKTHRIFGYDDVPVEAIVIKRIYRANDSSEKAGN